MTLHRPVVLVGSVLLAAGAFCPFLGCRPRTTVSFPFQDDRLVLDADRRVLPWTSYGRIVDLTWSALQRFPVQPNGAKTYFSYSMFHPETLDGWIWVHNPASFHAMLADSALLSYPFLGDPTPLEITRALLDHHLAHGMTPSDWSWGGVPFASSNPGSLTYAGGDDDWTCKGCGRGDGIGVIEPDKAGELGYAWLRFYEQNGDRRYLDAATACADTLARHVREGDEKRSPWPFRVYAETGRVREEYSAHVLGPVMLFDELIRIGAGDLTAYRRARHTAWSWLMKFPMANDCWSGYFEDISIQKRPCDNLNQYVPLQTAKYLIEHPEYDADWKTHARHLIQWSGKTFGRDTDHELGTQYGATVLSEQNADMAKMGSHTARFAALDALFYERTGEVAAREAAFRAFNWATYMCNRQGIVKVGFDYREGYWFSDGYADYIRHFLVGMAAVPEWAPAENRILRSSSVIRSVAYEPSRITYETFDFDGDEVLRLEQKPIGVVSWGMSGGEGGGANREGRVSFTVSMLGAEGGAGVAVRIQRWNAKRVVVTLR